LGELADIARPEIEFVTATFTATATEVIGHHFMRPSRSIRRTQAKQRII